MTKSKLLQKWEEQKEMHRRVCEDSLMWTKEERLKSSAQVQVLCGIIADIKTLESLD
jgi:hypothetical protein